MGSQVAVAEVAVVPTFKGLRKEVTSEVEGSATTAASGFKRIFSKTGTDSGKATGAGFKNAFDQSSSGTSAKLTKAIEADVAKATRALSTARLKEQDLAGKVRVAEAQLAEARKKYAGDSSQVIRAQERMESSSRQLGQAHKVTEDATDDLKKAQGELARAADRAGDELADAGDNGVKGFRSNVIGGVKSFAGPLIAAFAALGIGRIVADAFREARDFVLGAITLASDLEQSVGGVDAVFKDQASAIHGWSKAAADAVGLSRSAYNEFATVVGAQLKNLGMPLGGIAGQTNDLVELGSDLAAQFGGPTSDAVAALSSLLRGEANPIERYGVSINQAAIKAEALALGLFGVSQDADKVAAAQIRAEVAQRKYNEALEKYGEDSSQAMSAQATMISANSALEKSLKGTTDELTAQQKAQATLSLLYKQTADAQGAFARESDTLAGKQQRNAAAWENVSTRIGEAFLPVASQIADILGKDVIPVIAEMAEEVGPELAETFADMVPQLAELAQELLPLLPEAIGAVVAVLPAFMSMLELITPLLILMTQATGDQNSILSALFGLISGDESVQEFGRRLSELAGPIGAVLDWGAGLLMGFSTWFAGIPAEAQKGIDSTIGWLTGLPGRATAAVGNLGSTLFGSGRALMDGFLAGIESMIDNITSTVSSAIDWVVGFFPHSPAKRGPLSGSGWSNLKKSGKATWAQFLDGFGDDGPAFPSFPGGPDTGISGPRVSGRASIASARGGDTYQFNGQFAMTPEEIADVIDRRKRAAYFRSGALVKVG